MKITAETKWMVGLVSPDQGKLHITKCDEDGLKHYIEKVMMDVFKLSYYDHDVDTAWNAASVSAVFGKLTSETLTAEKGCMLFELNEELILMVQLHQQFEEEKVRKDFPNLTIEDHTMCIGECQHKPSKQN